MGQRLLGNSDVAWKIWSNNGDLFTITNGAVIKPPALRLAAGQPVFGAMDVVGIVGNGLNPAAADSFTPWPLARRIRAARSRTLISRPSSTPPHGARCPATRRSRRRAKWEIEFQPTWQPVKVQGWTIDYKLTSMMITAKCLPFGPTAAQTYAAVESFAAGSRIGDISIGDITITGDDGTTVFTLKNMALKERGYQFGAEQLAPRRAHLGQCHELCHGRAGRSGHFTGGLTTKNAKNT